MISKRDLPPKTPARLQGYTRPPLRQPLRPICGYANGSAVRGGGGSSVWAESEVVFESHHRCLGKCTATCWAITVVTKLVLPILVFDAHSETIGRSPNGTAQVIHDLHIDEGFSRSVATKFIFSLGGDEVGKSFKRETTPQRDTPNGSQHSVCVVAVAWC